MTSRLIRTDLASIPDNPPPPGAMLATVEAADGVALRVAWWRPARRPRGTVLLIQGRAEFIEKYFETVGDLLARGFGVVAFDWRGQGGSGRRLADASKGHVGDFAEYRLDLAAIARHVDAIGVTTPVIGLAHSMGGAIALEAALDGSFPARALVTLAPMIDLKMVKHPGIVRVIIRALDRLGWGSRFVPGGTGRSISTEMFLGNRLSGDASRYARNAALARHVGPVAVGAPTIGWLAAAYQAMAVLQRPRVAAAITLPVLMIGAGDDPVCLTSAAEVFAASLPQRQGALVIEGARHEILMESDAIRAAFWSAFDAFALQFAPSDAAPLSA